MKRLDALIVLVVFLSVFAYSMLEKPAPSIIKKVKLYSGLNITGGEIQIIEIWVSSISDTDTECNISAKIFHDDILVYENRTTVLVNQQPNSFNLSLFAPAGKSGVIVDAEC
ncbi:MAG: hypothetical protein GOU99_01785 [Candidatus Altiarchaeota archaeon]|nr:hypothetical protein [Candidatus Altiarchaeota archaeon]